MDFLRHFSEPLNLDHSKNKELSHFLFDAYVKW